MTRRAYIGPQGKLQRHFYSLAVAQPQKLHPLPSGTAERLAIRRMAEKQLLEIDDDGTRWKLRRPGRRAPR